MSSASTERLLIKRYWLKAQKPFQKPLMTNDSQMDELAVEEPLEIRLVHISKSQELPHPTRSKIAVTMRTPGHDIELAAGYLFAESVLTSPDQILETRSESNWVEFTLSPEVRMDLRHHERRTYVSSSCGVCGKSSIEDICEEARYSDQNRPGSPPFISAQLIADLPNRLRDAQRGFSKTGGTHASGLFTARGELQCLREDVGRHNALDKVIGRAFLDRKLPLDQSILILSGRVSFELMQKAAMAGIRVIAAVGAPSSLAVQIAQEFDLTLIGFIRDGHFNVYHGDWRVIPPAS
jgi:FdhD protein